MNKRRVLVCLKQVPRPGSITFDARTKRVLRNADTGITNPPDLAALGHALTLRRTGEWEVIAITMGPTGARETLHDALTRGADRVLHLEDRRFAGADTLATARALAKVVEREKADLVLTGHWTLDGGTGQVGPQMAELVGYSLLTDITELRSDGESDLYATRETELGSERWHVPLPAVLSIKRGPIPHLTVEGHPDAADVRSVTVEDLSCDPLDFGTRGSPTFVANIRPSAPARQTKLITGTPNAVTYLTDLIDAPPCTSPSPFQVAQTPTDALREIWVVVEPLPDRSIHPTSLEALACARSVATALRATTVAVIGCSALTDQPDILGMHGADRVLAFVGQSLHDYSADSYVQWLGEAIAERIPFAVIAPFSARGRDYLPRVAARLKLALTGDFTALDIRGIDTEDPDLIWLKPSLSGSVVAEVIGHTTPSLGTLRPGSFAKRTYRRERTSPAVEIHRVDSPIGHPSSHRIEELIDVRQPIWLAGSQVVVGLGADITPAIGSLARELVTATGGALGATAAAVASGQAPAQFEIGPFARAIAPRLYIGLGHHDLGTLSCLSEAASVVLIDPTVAASEVDGLANALIADDIPAVLSGLIHHMESQCAG